MLPGPISKIIVALCVLGAVLARLTEWPPDRAGQNVITMASIGLALFTLGFWFVFFSGYAASVRHSVGIVVFVAIGALAGVVRFDRFTGDMVPTFRFVWSLRSDERLGQLKVDPIAANLSSPTPLDFPQFLGPQRNAIVDTIELADSWQSPPTVIWKQPIGAGWSAFAAVSQFAVTLEQRGPDELVTCYEIATGRLAWAHGIEARHETVLGGVGPRSTPTIHGGRVFALGGTGVLRCLDASSGDLIWSHDVPERFGLAPGQDTQVVAWGRANSPLIVDDLVVVPAGGPPGKAVSLVAFKQADGTEAWRAGSRQISYSSPILATFLDRRQIIVVNEDAITGHDPATGRELWLADWPGNSSADANTSQPTVFGTSLVISKGYPGGGLARFTLDGQTATRVYHFPNLLKTKLTSLVLQPASSFAFGISDGILECVDLDDGQRQWKGGRYGHGQILLVGQLLLVLSERGELALVRATAEKFEEIARVPVLDGTTWNNPCLYGRFLLVRNSEEAAALELPVVTP